MVGVAGRGLVGAGGELGLCPWGSCCVLTACAALLQLVLRTSGMHCTLAAHACRLRALAALILHCKKYMISYMITAKNIRIHTWYEFIFVWIHIFKVQKVYEFILTSSYTWIHMLYEFIHSTGCKIKNFPWNWTISHNTCTTTTPPHCLR